MTTGQAAFPEARILKVLLDLDVLETTGCTPQVALEAILERTGWYDPDILEPRQRVQVAVPDSSSTLTP